MSVRLSLYVTSTLAACVGLGLCGCGSDPARADGGPGEFRDLEDGLELHWSFEDHVDDQITDLSGNGRHGALVGGSFVSSPLGEAVALDGIDDYVGLTELGLRDPALYGGVAGDFTVSARVRVADVDKYNTLCLGCGPFSALYVGTPIYGPKLLAALSKQLGGKLWPLSTTDLVNEEWREITMVVEGGTLARYYLDCVADGELVNANIGLADFNFSAVGQGVNASRWFGGEIDRLQVWSRALPEGELSELCAPPPPVDESLQLHWTFEDRVGNQITDLSGNGHHGNLNGGSFVASPEGEAATLDGVDDFIAFTGPRDPAIYGGVDGNFTVSARVRVADIDKYNTLCTGCGPSSTWLLGDPAQGGRMSSAFFDQDSGAKTWTASTAALAADTWTEVTMVIDGGTSVRHYFGCGFDSETLDPDIGLKNYNYSAVGLSTNAARWFGGEIDELRVWDRALSDVEVGALCGSGGGGLCDGAIHVDVDAPDGGDGLSWASAFNDLPAALDASLVCDSPELWVAEGTYGSELGGESILTITAPVSLYGGFDGTELTRAERDFAAHVSRIGTESWWPRIVTITDTAIEVGQTVRLDGFTIKESIHGAIEAVDLEIDTDESVVALHNLVLYDNQTDEGGGLRAQGKFGVELVGTRIEASRPFSPEIRGAAIYSEGASLDIDDCQFIDNEGEYAVIYQEWSVYGEWGTTSITNSVVSGSLGGGIRAPAVTAINTTFSNNTQFGGGDSNGHGGALYVTGGYLDAQGCSFTANVNGHSGGALRLNNGLGAATFSVIDSDFTGNSAKHGGAIYIERSDDLSIDLQVEGGQFVDNFTDNSGPGGALYIGDVDQVAIDGVSFTGNTAAGTGGAIWAGYGGITSVANSTFVDNVAKVAGAIHVNTLESFELRDSRLISNDATARGGALGISSVEAINATVINTEFIANTAGTNGGAVDGRANFVATTFADNVAGGTGNALFAPGGPGFTLRDVVAWPDNFWAGGMTLDHACIPQPAQNVVNAGSAYLVADPFTPADLDSDGLSEYYLAPGSDCVDLGDTVDEFDWSTMTTQVSQCTDSTPLDAGVHYPPQAVVGSC